MAWLLGYMELLLAAALLARDDQELGGLVAMMGIWMLTWAANQGPSRR